MLPRVSVIIPHFNRASLLRDTLRSLQRQDATDWEAIVVDDGSDEAEWQLATRFADQRVVFLRRSDGLKGPSRCRNLGVSASRSPVVMFLDSDDLLAPWCLSRRLEVAARQPDADLHVFPVLLFREVPGDLNCLWNSLDEGSDLERFLISDPPWHTSSPLWRKEAFERLGGFDEQLMYGDDADLHTRALLKGLGIRKHAEQLPDVFVRRSEAERITNRVSPALLESRLRRLARGTELLTKQGSDRQRRLWEGQYLAEAEFLLFSAREFESRIPAILRDWRERYSPGLLRTLVVSSYFALARAFRDRIYLLLRIARRTAMSLLPYEFFPRSSGQFHRAVLPEAEWQLLQRSLGTPSDPSADVAVTSGNGPFSER